MHRIHDWIQKIASRLINYDSILFVDYFDMKLMELQLRWSWYHFGIKCDFLWSFSVSSLSSLDLFFTPSLLIFNKLSNGWSSVFTVQLLLLERKYIKKNWRTFGSNGQKFNCSPIRTDVHSNQCSGPVFSALETLRATWFGKLCIFVFTL